MKKIIIPILVIFIIFILMILLSDTNNTGKENKINIVNGENNQIIENIVENNSINNLDKFNTSNETINNAENNKNIKMPYSSQYFIDKEYNAEELKRYLENLGFKNIEVNQGGSTPVNENVIIDVKYKTWSMGKYKQWNENEELDKDWIIQITENTNLILTRDNCEDLAKLLDDPNYDHNLFIWKYKGKTIQFKAIVINNDEDSKHGSQNPNVDVKSITSDRTIHIWQRKPENLTVGDEVIIKSEVKEKFNSWPTFYLENATIN